MHLKLNYIPPVLKVYFVNFNTQFVSGQWLSYHIPDEHPQRGLTSYLQKKSINLPSPRTSPYLQPCSPDRLIIPFFTPVCVKLVVARYGSWCRVWFSIWQEEVWYVGTVLLSGSRTRCFREFCNVFLLRFNPNYYLVTTFLSFQFLVIPTSHSNLLL